MKRFTLRNKSKIVNTHGLAYYNLLIDSLKKYFSTAVEIEEHQYHGLKNKIIHVPSTFKNSEAVFEFALISKTFDVYNLAYYSAMS